MSAEQHTPGRLKVGQHLGSLSSFCIHMDVGDKGRGAEIVEAVCGLSTEQRLANARRLAACWNACEGIDTEDLEKASVSIIHKLHDDAAKQTLAQRDRLLNEIKKVREVIAAWNQAFVETATNRATGLIDDPEDILIAEADQDVLNGIDAAIAACQPKTTVAHLPSDDTEGGAV
jgi:hypothetical protein